MVFFDVVPSDTSRSGTDFVVSETFWIYWAVTLPLTLLTITFWIYREPEGVIRSYLKRKYDEMNGYLST